MWIFFFAILCFLFVFFCYTLPCFLLVLGDWAYRVICFVVYCYLFILFYFFFNLIYFYFFYFCFTFMDFLGLFFVSLTALGTSSLRLIVFPWGGGCTGAPFRGLVSRGSKLYKWWFWRASGLVDMELMKWYRGNGWRWVGKTIPGRGAVSGCSPPGWSWLDDLGDGVNCFVFFSYLLKIHGDWWLRDLFCLLQGAVKAPMLGSEFHGAFWNIIPVTTPIELRRLLMLPRRKERGETSPKILLNCWVGVVKIPLCSDGLENVVKCSKIE